MINKPRVETDVESGEYIILNTKGSIPALENNFIKKAYPNKYKIKIDVFGVPVIIKEPRCYG